jgi:hypothetical protein
MGHADRKEMFFGTNAKLPDGLALGKTNARAALLAA